MALRAPIQRPNLLWRASVIGGIGALKALTFSDAAWEWWEENVTDRIPRRRVQALLTGTLALHAVESAATYRVARRARLPHAGAHARTAFTYGFPQYFIVKRAAAVAAEPGSR